MKLFLTGGTGFFGKAILRELLARYENNSLELNATVLSRNPKKFLIENPVFTDQPWLRILAGDIGDKKSFPYKERFTHVLHAATDSTTGPQLSPSQRFFQIINGTQNILEFAIEVGAERFLLTSSGGVYGSQPPELASISEERNCIPDPLDANNAYSIAKRAAENMCAIYAKESNLHIVIARCFAFVGEDLPLDAHFAIGNFLRDALSGSKIIVKGDGSPVRTYLDQRDLSQWLLKLLVSGKSGNAYNVGSDEQITIGDLANLIRDMVDPNLEVEITNISKNENLRNRYVPQISKIRDELGVKVNYSLRESLLKVIDAKSK